MHAATVFVRLVPLSARYVAAAATALVALHGSVWAQSVAPSTTPGAASIAVAEEFPEGDGSAWVLQKRGQTPRYIAARLAQDRPGLDLVALAWQADRYELAVDLLRAYIDARPADDLKTLDLIATHWRYAGPFRTARYRPQFERLLGGIEVIRRRLSSHPRETAARIAWQFLRIDDAAAQTPKVGVDAAARQAFVQQWSGTLAAQYAEIEARLLPPITDEALDGVEQFAREHAGTEAGARAWAGLAVVLSALDIPIPGTPVRKADPTERFLRLHRTLRALQDDSPSREWTKLVPGLGNRYSMRSPVFGPDGPTRLLDAYRDFLVWQLTLAPLDESAVDTLAGGASRTMPWMLAEGGVDVAAAMESLFDQVEAAVPTKAEARHLRSRFYLVQCAIVSDAPNPAMCLKARTALAELAEGGAGRYSRLAHAELAAELFLEGEHALARAQYLSYVERHPRSDWAWMAALRAGQCSESLGERHRARDEYRRAAGQYAENPLARVLGLTYAARVSDALGARTRALADYRAARGAWSRDYGVSYTVSNPFLEVDPWKVTLAALDRRIRQLSQPQK